jgi:hypothetical protein
VISEEYLWNNKPVSMLADGSLFKTTILSAKLVVVPLICKFPPTYKSLLTAAPPSSVSDPPEPTPAAFVVSNIYMGLLLYEAIVLLITDNK